MKQHTQEPWKLYRNDQSVGDARGYAVCDVWPRSDDGMASEEGRANARRIVACVNACAGWETGHLEAMEQGSLKESLERVIWQRDTLQVQIDELLEAAKRMLDSVAFVNFGGQWNNSFTEDVDLTKYCQPLQDVINKITGETK